MTTTFNGFEIDKHNKLVQTYSWLGILHAQGIKIARYNVLQQYYEEMLKDSRSPHD